jgi:hypothetical protein
MARGEAAGWEGDGGRGSEFWALLSGAYPNITPARMQGWKKRRDMINSS